MVKVKIFCNYSKTIATIIEIKIIINNAKIKIYEKFCTKNKIFIFYY